jgi:hypothetical protein
VGVDVNWYGLDIWISRILFFLGAAAIVVCITGLVISIKDQPQQTLIQTGQEVKTVHKIVYIECGKHKFRVGENGVRQIGIPKDTPGLWIIEYESGNRTMLFPTETVLVVEEEQHIIVPDVVASNGTLETQ